MNRRANRLSAEKSPYLLQHAYNPVDWFPWGEEALQRAKAEDRPIFLSIGYSTCHWCHVMERESFENPEIAAILNALYVPIKVDREERPDIDRIYMTAVQAMTGAGGWPLSAWLTPDREPFYTGTYFPPNRRYGRPGFGELLEHLAQAWHENRDQVLENAQRVGNALRHAAAESVTDGTTKSTLELLQSASRRAFERCHQIYDTEHGGFGDAPKFPRPTVICFLLRHGLLAEERTAIDMALHTLQEIWSGGIHDHLGGGYHRYSVDRYWRVPHFEKMLYDQAQLVWAFLDAFLISGNRIFAVATRDTLDYIARDLTGAHGGLFSAEDADSEPVANGADSDANPDPREPKQEGAFYLWSAEEISRRLDPESATILRAIYGVEDAGNTLSDPHGELGHLNVLYAARSPQEVALTLGRTPQGSVDRNITARQEEDPAVIGQILQRSRTTLLAARDERPRPDRDEKVITAWNGLAISAFARAGAILDDAGYRTRACQAARFVLEECVERDATGGLTLYRRWCDGERAHAGQLDDYAAFALGLTDLYQATGTTSWLLLAAELTAAALERFDDGAAGFFDSPPGDRTLLMRSRDLHDGAEPSGTALVCHALVRLGRVLDRPHWIERAELALRSSARHLEQQPDAVPHLVGALQLLHGGDHGQRVVIAGSDLEAVLRMSSVVWRARPVPGRELVLLGADASPLRELVPFYRQLIAPDEGTRAWVCGAQHCGLPVQDPGGLEQALAGDTPNA